LRSSHWPSSHEEVVVVVVDLVIHSDNLAVEAIKKMGGKSPHKYRQWIPSIVVVVVVVVVVSGGVMEVVVVVEAVVIVAAASVVVLVIILMMACPSLLPPPPLLPYL